MKKLIFRDSSRQEEKFFILIIGAFVLSLLVFESCGINFLPSKDDWYAQHYFIMHDFERAAYKALSAEGKKEFQGLFWEARWPEAKNVFMARIDFIMKAFKKENSRQPWNTARSRIYLLNGNPESIDYKQNDFWAMQVREGAGVSGQVSDRSNEDVQARTAEVWTYRYDKYLIDYIFNFIPPSEWRLSPATFSGNRYLGELEKLNREQTYGIIDIDRYTADLENLKKIK